MNEDAPVTKSVRFFKQTMISARDIAIALGGQVAGPNTVLCPGPGHSASDRSLAVKLDPRAPDGFLCFSHAGDSWQSCRHHVRTRLGLPAWQPGDGRQRSVPQQHAMKWDLAAIEAEADDIPRAFGEEELDRVAYANLLWDEGADPHGTLAETYLREHRRLDLSDNLARTVLRYHAQCPWRDENTGATDLVPALIAPFRSIDSDSITGIHRIALNDDGSKRGRRMLGVVRRTAIKLDQINGHSLVIGEGVETCMAARQLRLKPVWALGSVGAISFFPLLDGIKELIVLGEHDEASTRAADICISRWRKAGRRVRIAIPDPGYSDFNDILIAEIVERTAS
jgi:Toprim domain-containing protein